MAAAPRALALLLVLGATWSASASSATHLLPQLISGVPMPDSLLLTEHLGTMLHHLAIAPPLHTQPLARRLMQSDSSSAEGEGALELGPLEQQQQQQDAHVQGQPPEAQMRAGFGAKLLASPAASVLGGTLPSQWDYKIVGGKTAPPARFKWFCSMRSATTDFHFCGCSLIAPNIVLTAAHCLDQASNALKYPMIEVGRYFRTAANSTAASLIDNNYDRARCTRSVVHAGWTPSTARNDIALCFFNGASRFTPVRLAQAGNDTLPDGTPLTVIGFGLTKEGGTASESLMMTNVDVISPAGCNISYAGMLGDAQAQICAGVPSGGADACQGDSGGPLFAPAAAAGGAAAADTQFGVVSFGSGCGRKGFPGVYTDVRAYGGWIQQQIALAAGGSDAPADAATVTTSSGPQTAAAPGQAAAGGGACGCTATGVSGGVDVGKADCAQHGLDYGDDSYFCYVNTPADCAPATASTAYPGAAWIACAPAAAARAAPLGAGTPTTAATAAAAAPAAQRGVRAGALLKGWQRLGR